MRVSRFLVVSLVLAVTAGRAGAEYVVLRSGQRISVTGYQLANGRYTLQLKGGTAKILAEDVVRIEPEDTFEAIAPEQREKAPFRELIAAAAAKYSVDVDLITSVIAVESNFNPRAVSRRNARGLMQLLPETAAQFGTRDIFDPRQNIEAGTQYLSQLLAQYRNNLVLALAAYNAGPRRVDRFGRVPPYNETQSYVRRVQRNYDQRKSGLAPKTGTTEASAAGPPKRNRGKRKI